MRANLSAVFSEDTFEAIEVLKLCSVADGCSRLLLAVGTFEAIEVLKHYCDIVSAGGVSLAASSVLICSTVRNSTPEACQP